MKLYNQSILLLLLMLFIHQYAHSQNIERAKKNIDTLCSVSYFGRGYTKGGLDSSRLFIKNHFKTIGIEPLWNTYEQAFAHPINTFPERISLHIDNVTLTVGNEFLPDAGNPAVSIESLKLIEIDSAFLKRGSPSSWLKTLKGKVPYCTSEIFHRLMQHSFEFKETIVQLPLLILIEKKLTHSVSTQVAPLAIVSIDEKVWPKKPKKITYHQPTKYLSSFTSYNIGGYVRGTTHPETYILIGAHYDHLGGIGDNVYFPGANDNAAGISMLFELAHYIRENPLPYTVVFVAFAGEEAGLLGSWYFTEHPPFPLLNTAFMLNLDLVGTGEDGLMVVNGMEYFTAFERLVSINQKSSYVYDIKKRGKAANSDHHFFTEKGIPSFFMYLMGGIQAYHDPQDRVETLPLTAYEPLFQLITDFLQEIPTLYGPKE